MSSQEEKEEEEAEADDPPIIFGRGTRTAVFFVRGSTTWNKNETTQF